MKKKWFLTSDSVRLKVKGFKGYFTEKSYNDFEIFVSKNLPGTEGEGRCFILLTQRNSIAERFGLNPMQVNTEWVDLLINKNDSRRRILFEVKKI